MFDLRDPASDPTELYKKFRAWLLAGNHPTDIIDYDLAMRFFEDNFEYYPIIEDLIEGEWDVIRGKFDGIGLMLDVWVAGGQLVQIDDINYVDGNYYKVMKGEL